MCSFARLDVQMKNSRYIDGLAHMTLPLQTKLIRYYWLCFVFFFGLLNVATLFYPNSTLPNHVLIGSTSLVIVVIALVLARYKINNVKLVSNLISFGLLIRPIATLTKPLYGAPWPVAVSIGTVALQMAFWCLFMACVQFLIPYTQQRIELDAIIGTRKKELITLENQLQKTTDDLEASRLAHRKLEGPSES